MLEDHLGLIMEVPPKKIHDEAPAPARCVLLSLLEFDIRYFYTLLLKGLPAGSQI